MFRRARHDGNSASKAHVLERLGHVAGSIALAGIAIASTSTAWAQNTPANPWDTDTARPGTAAPSASPAATTPIPGQAADKALDPASMLLVPKSLPEDPNKLPPGQSMRTMKTFDDIQEVCAIVPTATTCSLSSTTKATDGQGGDPRFLNWLYTKNQKNRPIVLITVQGSGEGGQGLQIIYGTKEASDAIGRADMLDAIEAGAKILRPTKLGCQAACVYGLQLDDEPALLHWMVSGDALAFKFGEGKKTYLATAKLAGFKDAIADYDIAVRRTLDPGQERAAAE